MVAERRSCDACVTTFKSGRPKCFAEYGKYRDSKGFRQRFAYRQKMLVSIHCCGE